MTALTVNQAASLLGVVPQRVRAMIASGRLRATKWGSAWAITLADLDAVGERKAGRPRRAPATEAEQDAAQRRSEAAAAFRERP